MRFNIFSWHYFIWEKCSKDISLTSNFRGKQATVIINLVNGKRKRRSIQKSIARNRRRVYENENSSCLERGRCNKCWSKAVSNCCMCKHLSFPCITFFHYQNSYSAFFLHYSFFSHNLLFTFVQQRKIVEKKIKGRKSIFLSMYRNTCKCVCVSVHTLLLLLVGFSVDTSDFVVGFVVLITYVY